MADRATFKHTDRLHGPATFKAIYDNGLRETAGPLVGMAVPSTHPIVRIGISVPKRVGTAVRRNRVKRLIREAFRHAGPLRNGSIDLVIVVRPHDDKPLAEYQRWLEKLLTRLREKMQRGGPV